MHRIQFKLWRRRVWRRLCSPVFVLWLPQGAWRRQLHSKDSSSWSGLARLWQSKRRTSGKSPWLVLCNFVCVYYFARKFSCCPSWLPARIFHGFHVEPSSCQLVLLEFGVQLKFLYLHCFVPTYCRSLCYSYFGRFMCCRLNIYTRNKYLHSKYLVLTED